MQDHVLSLERWQACWRALGTSADEDLYRELIERYEEPQRKYHTLQHLEECLRNLEDLRSVATRPAEIEIALWFHDAIYDVRAKDNEVRSADLAADSLRATGIDEEVAGRVHALILATLHNAVPEDENAKILVDADLWILGAPWTRFAEYEEQVRAEYRWVPGFLFRRKRKQILREFAERERIFNTDLFFEKYEARARANLAQILGQHTV